MRQKFLIAVMMGSISTCIVSLTVIIINKGFFKGFLSVWLKSWITSYLIVVPTILFVGPKIQYLVNHLFPPKHQKKKS